MFNGVVGRVGDDINKIIGQVDGEAEFIVGGDLVVLVETVNNGEDAPITALSKDLIIKLNK